MLQRTIICIVCALFLLAFSASSSFGESASAQKPKACKSKSKGSKKKCKRSGKRCKRLRSGKRKCRKKRKRRRDPSSPSSRCQLTAAPLNQADYNYIIPLGNLNPSGHVFPTDHIYFVLTGGQVQVPVYAVGSLLLQSADSTTKEGTGQPPEYKYVFECGGATVYYGHLSNPSSRIQSAIDRSSSPSCNSYSTGGDRYRYCSYTISIRVSAGEQVALTSGQSHAFDLGSYDTSTTPLPYANSSRYYEAHLYATCPLDYYTSSLKQGLYGKLGNGDVTRTVEPRCGEVEQDVAGTAQGDWFFSREMMEDPHLALVHDNVVPARPVFSVGRSVPELSSGTYYYTAAASGLVNRDFSDITADGQVYCFDGLQTRWDEDANAGTIILQLQSATTLKIERKSDTSCGPGPWSFSSNAARFSR